ncbi:MAG: hypothetical protein MHPSP_003874, partial [Paramarteilia canceri]
AIAILMSVILSKERITERSLTMIKVHKYLKYILVLEFLTLILQYLTVEMAKCFSIDDLEPSSDIEMDSTVHTSQVLSSVALQN